MGRSFALLLAAAIAVGASASAQAADLLPPPPLPPMEPPPPDFGGWYLRGDVGVSANQLSSVSSQFTNGAVFVPAPAFNSATIGDSAFAGAGVGYQFNNWFRFDVTAEYQTAAQYGAVQSFANLWNLPCGARCYDLYHGQHSAAVFLANAYVDLGTWYGITPFIGGGVGVGVNWLENFYDISAQPAGGFGFAQNRMPTNFAWQLSAGLAYNVTPNLKLEVGYRYLDYGKMSTGTFICQGVGGGCPGEVQSFYLASHNVKLGFRYVIPTLTPPPPPLIRKY
jgi:opacity protein-like surface antigen